MYVFVRDDKIVEINQKEEDFMFTPLPYEERKNKRGMLTEEAKKIYFDFTGEELTREVLRLFPFLHYTVTNSHKIEGDKINGEERKILSEYHKAGYISRHMNAQSGKIEVEISDYGFYEMMSKILFVSYVNVAY